MSERVMLAHGNGGRFMRELIDEVAAAFGDEAPDCRCEPMRRCLPPTAI